MKSLVLLPCLLFPTLAFAPAERHATPTEPTYTIDSVHSSVVFRVKHVNTAWFWGNFSKVSGEFSLEGTPSVKVEIDAASVTTRNDNRDTHLKGPDFFDVKQFPTMTFTSSKVTKVKDGEYKVDGELDMHGQKKPLSFTATKTGEGQAMGKAVVGWETEFTIKRSDFGITGGRAGAMLGDEVKLFISLETSSKGGDAKK
jgi:polyisoprenoid-binding protein YceI